jgi:tetratricopeptide (TPR) repeat protein
MGLFKRIYIVLFLSMVLFSCVENSRDRYNMPTKDSFNLTDEQKAQISVLSDAIVSNPSDPSNYFKRSKALLNANNLTEAIIDITRAERFEPNNGEYLYLKAKIQMAQKDKNALLNAKRSEELGYQNIDLYILLSELNILAGAKAEATKYIEKANQIYPYSADLQISKGNLSMKYGDTATALIYFKRSLILGQHKIKPYQTLINNYLNLSILDSALKYTTMGLKKFPNSDELVLTRGSIFEKAGVSDSAIAVYKRVITKDPERFDVLEKIGNIYFKNRNFTSAFLIYDQLYKKLNENSKYLFKAADCYEAKGDYQMAIDYLEEKGDDYEEEKDMINRMNRLTKKIENNVPVEEPYVFPKPTVAASQVIKVKKPKAVPEPEPERRIFNSNIGTIEKIQKRSGIGTPKDSTRN